MLPFLDWWEREHSEAIALTLAGLFVEGVTEPYLELLSRGEPLPPWIETMLRWRLAAQWAFQQSIPLAARLERGLSALLPELEVPESLRITPQQIAEVPPSVRNAFIEGNRFSMSWVKRLSGDARELMGDLLSAQTLRNQNPMDAVTVLEQILRRDIVARELGMNPAAVTAEQVQQWLTQATFKVLEGIAQRAELIAVTEGARMQNMGILAAMEQQGDGLCYVMPHRGTCPECQRLLDGRVFRIEVLKRNLFENFGQKKQNWVPAMPQHPRCRHSPMEYPFQWRAALRGVDIPDEGILLEFYGLPGGRAAMESLGLRHEAPWLAKDGQMVEPELMTV